MMADRVSTPLWGKSSVKTDDLAPRLARALREALGLGQPGGMPIKQLAREMNVNEDTVQGWAAGNGIRGEHLYQLVTRMPLTFANAVFGDSGIVLLRPAETARAAELAAAEHIRVMGLLRQTIGRTKSIAKALADDAELAAVEEAGRKQDIRHAVEKLDRVNRRNGRPARNEVGQAVAEGAELGARVAVKP